MASTQRTPFAVLGESRLQTLGSIKNRQNNIFSSSGSAKTPMSAPAKRRLPSDLGDDFDRENVDPRLLLSPSKRSKGMDGTPTGKSTKLILTPSTAPNAINPPMKRKAVTSSVPTTSTSTPISHSRGSPQNKRLQLNGARRTLTPFRRSNPAKSFLPFSIDAALSGTLSSLNTPTVTPTIAPPSPPVLSKKSSKSMPGSWFFEIHEDTPDQEATNLMEHSASTLDISSDDDAMSARAKDALERGKENIPPPEYAGTVRASRPQRTAHKGIKCPIKAAAYADKGLDAMVEDRIALREMDATAFWDGEGEHEVVDEAKDESTQESLPVTKAVDVIEPEPFVIREDTPEKEVMAAEAASS